MWILKINYKMTRWYPIIGIVFVLVTFGLCLFAAYEGSFIPIIIYGLYWPATTIYDLWRVWQKVKRGGA